MRIGLFTAVQWSPQENPGAFLQALREQLRYAEIAKAHHILLRVQWPSLEHRQTLGHMERIGRIIAALS